MRQLQNSKSLFTKVVIFLLPFFLIGLLFNAPVELFCIGLICLILWNYHQLFLLIDWLWKKRGAYPPVSQGIWSDVFDGIYQQQRKHKKKRNELTVLVRRFRLGAESLPDAALVFNNDRTLVWCNSLAQSMLGFKWPEDMGNRIDNFLRQPEFIQYLEAEQYDKPFEFPSPENEFMTLECRIAPFEKDKWTLIARDVTQIKQMEQMRKDFIANVSHELRTPLTVMRGYLELLTETDVPEAAIWKKAHAMMNEQTIRMGGLVDQLLTLTKLENKQFVLTKSTVNVARLLHIIEDEASTLSENKHNITVDAEPNLFIRSSEEQIRSAFSNLIFNAVRYTPPGESIDISWKMTEDGGARFTCQDSGDGIAAEHLSRLTERFYRVNQARTRDSGGSGLGLSIVKHILANHDSDLEISSTVNVGSCFSFVIPASFIVKEAPPVHE
jgi:two-component system phosphate regulon sensor histidine kinase PhoR